MEGVLSGMEHDRPARDSPSYSGSEVERSALQARSVVRFMPFDILFFV